MNIYALEGHKVRCVSLTNGYESQQQMAQKYLVIGKEYTIKETEVDSSSTYVYLMEFPDVVFNSVLFEDTLKQSEEDDKKHLDWIRFNE